MKILKVLRTSLILGAVSVIGLNSCGGSKPETPKETKQIVTLSQKTIAGDLSDYFELVKTEYEIDKESFYPELEITVKRTNVNFPYDSEYIESFSIVSDDYVKVGLGVECYDKNGIPIIIVTPIKCYDKEIISLMKLNPGEFGKFTFNLSGGKVEDVENFKVTSALEVLNKKLIKKVTSNSSLNEWDSVLDAYEKYIDNYVKLLKKANSGDMSAITEYTSMLEKAEQLENKLNNAKGELTSSQLSRLTKIAQKMMNVAN